METIRVIQYGIGPIGAVIGKLMLEKPNVEIVGAIDADPLKAGKVPGLVAGLDHEVGVTVSADARAVLAQPAAIVVRTTSSLLAKVADELFLCVRAGKHVVSTYHPPFSRI
jgi:4-hydroxy-tetrahydrodipicolinate reductase